MKLFESKQKSQPKQEGTHASAGTARSGRMVVKKPRMTEKATVAKDTSNAYAFVVADSATKIDVAREIEKMYKVTVVKVNTVRMPRKAKQLGRSRGFVSGFKKAIVYLKKGDTISFA